MTYTQKYCLAWFASPISKGFEFGMADWPLHVTLADVFSIDRGATDIDTKLADMLAMVCPVAVTPEQDAVLGTTPVVLLTKNPAIIALHHKLVDILEANGATFNTPQFTRQGFLPHCTIQESARVHSGDKPFINSVALVDMFPGGDWTRRKILSVFSLEG